MTRLPLLLLLASTAACFTPRTAVVVPHCTERVEIEGPHKRATDVKYLLSHTWDLPLTQTRIEVKRVSGETDEEVFYHVVPDVVRLVAGLAGGMVGLIGAGYVGYRYLTIQDEGVSPTLLLLPISAGFFSFGALLALTGWHPATSEIVLESSCGEDGPAPPPQP